jgi:hypothetical protein
MRIQVLLPYGLHVAIYVQAGNKPCCSGCSWCCIINSDRSASPGLDVCKVLAFVAAAPVLSLLPAGAASSCSSCCVRDPGRRLIRKRNKKYELQEHAFARSHSEGLSTAAGTCCVEVLEMHQ